MINFSTGPISVEPHIKDALVQTPTSHRSEDFVTSFDLLRQLFCERLNVKKTFVLQGSGTLANDVMIYQIKARESKGLVLTNGEFGDRLIEQATRAQLDFGVHREEWGMQFDKSILKYYIQEQQPSWILMTHCETSTGMLNNIKWIAENAPQCELYVDCMSSIGLCPMELSDVAMATASSSKGLASLSGVALVFSNIEIVNQYQLPKYYDLHFYEEQNGIPFTISSNLINALFLSTQDVLTSDYQLEIRQQAEQIYSRFKPTGLIPFATPSSRIFTFVHKDRCSKLICEEMIRQGIMLSYQSRYLTSRNWFQLALFGNHSPQEVKYSIDSLDSILKVGSSHLVD